MEYSTLEELLNAIYVTERKANDLEHDIFMYENEYDPCTIELMVEDLTSHNRRLDELRAIMAHKYSY